MMQFIIMRLIAYYWSKKSKGPENINLNTKGQKQLNPSLKPHIIAAKASKKDAYDKDDANNAIQSDSSFGTGLR